MVAAKKADFYAIAQQYHISPVMARIIRNRDVIEEADIRKFLHGTRQDLYAPDLLKDMDKAVDILLELGVRQVFLSMGAAGVLYGNARGKKRIPNYPAEIRNTTGAGDSFMAALVMAYLSEFSTEKAARCGLAAAAICIEGENTINEKLSRQAVLDRISEN